MLKMIILHYYYFIHIIFALVTIKQNNMDDFDNYAISIDSECYEQDFDDVDLYATKMVEEEDDGFADKLGIEFE